MTKIEWTERSWNPIVGCSIVSPGCTNCYAMQMAARIERMSPQLEHYKGLTKRVNGKAVWTGKLALAPRKTLLEPLRRKRPTMWFVNSMSDLFHEDVPDWWIYLVLAVMAHTYEPASWDDRHVVTSRRQRHVYQVLTKRPARMRSFLTDLRGFKADNASLDEFSRHPFSEASRSISLNAGHPAYMNAPFSTWQWVADGFPGLWAGVSCERQQEADERIPDLLATPAAVRFVSAEPLLGPIDFTSLPSVSGIGRHLDALSNAGCAHADIPSKLDWVIVGGESGPDARRLWTDNVRSIVRQCQEAGVPVYVKQLGTNVQDRNDAGFDGDHDSWPWEHDCEGRIEENLSGYYDGYQGAPVRIHLKSRKGANPEEWPPALRVRQYPKARCSEAEDPNA